MQVLFKLFFVALLYRRIIFVKSSTTERLAEKSDFGENTTESPSTVSFSSFGAEDEVEADTSTWQTDAQENAEKKESTTSEETPLWSTVMDRAQLIVVVTGYVANLATFIALIRHGQCFSGAICELLKHQSLVDSCVLAMAGILLLQPPMWRTSSRTTSIAVCHLWHGQAPYWAMVFVSIWNLVLISYERYLAVCLPFSHQNLTRRRARLAMSLIYPFTLPVTILGYMQVTFDDAQHRCVPQYKIPGQLGKDIFYGHAIVCFFAYFVIPFACYVVMYGRILYALGKRKKDTQLSTTKSHIIQAASDSMTRTAVTLTLIFIISIGFVQWHYVLAYAGVVDYGINGPVQKIGVFLAVFNSCINPYVYMLFMPAYRQCLKKTFLCCLFKRQKEPGSTTFVKLSETSASSVNSKDGISTKQL